MNVKASHSRSCINIHPPWLGESNSKGMKARWEINSTHANANWGTRDGCTACKVFPMAVNTRSRGSSPWNPLSGAVKSEMGVGVRVG